MHKQIHEALIEVLGKDKVSISETERFAHSHDESFHPPQNPDVVVFPENKSEIKEILSIAHHYRKPIIPFGAGSGLEGQVIPIYGGVTLDFSNMNRIVSYHPEDMHVTVQPGLTRKALNKKINRDGLEFPIDPGADASIGGMAATNASGTTAVKYGAMKDQILTMEVILSDGSIIRTGSKIKKNVSGYSLNDVFVGSEGTLGIISEITLKLHGILESKSASRATFSSMNDCIQVAQSVLKWNLSIRRMELIDKISMIKINEYMGTSYPEAHTIFFEIGETTENVIIHQKRLEEIINKSSALTYDIAMTATEATQLWKARHEITYAFKHQEGKAIIGTDVCVPISQLNRMIQLSRDLLNTYQLDGGIIGHIGDGNFHTLIVYDKRFIEEKEKAESVHAQLVNEAIEAGGTCTGEHGVGLGKKPFQSKEHGDALNVMRQIKKMFDPEGLMNPGKIFDM